MATANFTINPEDGWVAVSPAAPAFIRIRSNTPKHAFFVTTSSTGTPATTVIGFKVNGHDFWCNVVATGQTYYARTHNSNPDKTRIDVFTL